mgnify:CR=1 FL=1
MWPSRSGRPRHRGRGKNRQHAAPAPAVAEPAGRQGTGREGDEAAEGKRQQLAVGGLELTLQGQHHGGVEQHEEMVLGVPDVDEQHLDAGPGCSGAGIIFFGARHGARVVRISLLVMASARLTVTTREMRANLWPCLQACKASCWP